MNNKKKNYQPISCSSRGAYNEVNGAVAILVLFLVISVNTQTVVYSAIAVVSPLTGEPISGAITFTQNITDGTMTVTTDITGITTNPDSLHGIHIHLYGDLRGTMSDPFSAPGTAVSGGLSVGSHFNPTGAPHGCPPRNSTDPPSQYHLGDLGNWQAVGGSIKESKVLPSLIIDGNPQSLIGRAVVLHAATDDCVNGSSSGGRLAGGVIGIRSVPAGTVNLAKGPVEVTEAVCVLQGTSNCKAGPLCNIGKAGVITLSRIGNQIRVIAQISSINSPKGFHIHTFGDLSSTDGTSAGGHYNPDGHSHGLPGASASYHLGDLGIIQNFYQTFGIYDYVTQYAPSQSMGLGNLIGRAVVVHEQVDHGNDASCGAEATTTGAAGKREYYCVIGLPNIANQSISTNYLPVPSVPTGFVFNNSWTNTPCVASGPVNLVQLGFVKSQLLTPEVTLHWKPTNAESTNIELALRATTTGWIAVGWTGGQFKMVGSDAVIGWAGANKQIQAYSLRSKSESGIVAIDSVPLTDTYIELVDGVTTLTFKRPLQAGTHSITPTGPNVVIGATGPSPSISMHTSNTEDLISIDFSTGSTVITEQSDLETVHLVLMIIGWSLLLVAGVFIARYGKEALPEIWINIHIGLQVVGYLTVFISFIIALVMVNGSHFNTVWHAQLGFTIVLITIPQFIYGFLRPHKEEKPTTARKVFEIIHPWFGRILLLASVIQIYGGFAMEETGGGWIFLYSLWLVIVILLSIALQIRSNDSARNSISSCLEGLPGCHCCVDCIKPENV